MSNLIRHVSDLTPALLTDLLVRRGMLEDGQVESIRSRPGPETRGSSLAHLDVMYAPGSDADAPQRLFLKVSKPDFRVSSHEVDFYARVEPEIPDSPVPHCVDAVHDTASGMHHLLFEDVSQTHVALRPGLEWPGTIESLSADQVVEAFAKVHGALWRGDSSDPTLESAGSLSETIRMDATTEDSDLSGFFEYMGDRMNGEDKALCEAIARRSPELTADRLAGERHITVAHRDANIWNVMLPLHPAKDRVLITDWASYTPWFGVDDLASHIARFWHPSVRRSYE